VLLVAGRPRDAERAFREALAKFPENGWSLRGLAAALWAQGKAAEAGGVEVRFRRAWATADIIAIVPCGRLAARRGNRSPYFGK